YWEIGAVRIPEFHTQHIGDSHQKFLLKLVRSDRRGLRGYLLEGTADLKPSRHLKEAFGGELIEIRKSFSRADDPGNTVPISNSSTRHTAGRRWRQWNLRQDVRVTQVQGGRQERRIDRVHLRV